MVTSCRRWAAACFALALAAFAAIAALVAFAAGWLVAVMRLAWRSKGKEGAQRKA